MQHAPTPPTASDRLSAEQVRRCQRLHDDVLRAVKRHAVDGHGSAMPGGIVWAVNPTVMIAGLGAALARVLVTLDDDAFTAALRDIATAARHFRAPVRDDLEAAAREAGGLGNA